MTRRTDKGFGPRHVPPVTGEDGSSGDGIGGIVKKVTQAVAGS